MNIFYKRNSTETEYLLAVENGAILLTSIKELEAGNGIQKEVVTIHDNFK